MFGMSLSEILIVGIVALVVLGPEKTPKAARFVGHLLGKARRTIADVKEEMERETRKVADVARLPGSLPTDGGKEA